MINTPNRLEKAVHELVFKHVEDFTEGLDKTQMALWRKMKGLLGELSTDRRGNIKRTASNRAVLGRLRRAIMPAIMTDAYKGRVARFNAAYGKLSKVNDEYLRFLVEAFQPNEALTADLQAEAIELTVNSLTEAGLDANMVTPLRKILNDNVNSGSALFDLEEQVRLFTLGDDKRLGRLRSYAGQITRDALTQYNANYHETFAGDLGLEFVFYSRGTVEDTRKFCAERNGKYYHIEEARAWGLIPQWQGRIAGTNPSNILIYRGGHNCLHNITYIHTSVVPQDVKDRAAAKGFYKPAKQPEPEPVGVSGVAPDGFQFGPDLPKSIRDKFTFNGNHPNMPDNFKDYGVDLPDQFWDLMPSKVNSTKIGSAHYDKVKNIVNVPTTGIYSNPIVKKTVLVHEYGHAWHNLTDFIKEAKFGKQLLSATNEEFKALYSEFGKALTSRFGRKGRFDSPVLELMQDAPKLKEMASKLGFSEKEIGVFANSTLDTIAAITKGRHGSGHAMSYWKIPGAQYAELFAHLNENFWVGNPVFKELYPEIYEEGLKFMQNLYGL